MPVFSFEIIYYLHHILLVVILHEVPKLYELQNMDDVVRLY